MDERLFKAKTTKKDDERSAFDSVWVEGDLIHSGGKTYIHPISNLVRVAGEIGQRIIMHEVIPETVCRYSGKKDKKGKKIWENDLLFVEYGDFIRVAKVTYDEQQAWYILEYQDGDYGEDELDPLLEFTTGELKIKSNIFDNPNLLGEV